MSAGAGDRRTRRAQSTSLAVVTTLAALLLALGVSVTMSRRSTMTAAATPAPTEATMASAASSTSRMPGGDGGRESRPASRSRTETHPDPSPEPPAEEGSTDGTGHARGRPEKAPKPAPTERMQLRRAAPGSWDVRVERASGSVLGTMERTDTRFAVTDLGDGSQRVALEAPLLALVSEVVRYDPWGRRVHEMVIDGAGDEPIAFHAVEGLADVPAEFSSGDSWQWHTATDDRRTSLAGKLQVVGREPPPGPDGSAPARTDVVRYNVELAIGGDRSITITRSVWFATELGLPVRVEERAHGTDPSGRVVDHAATLTLRSRPAPAKGNRTVENPATP